MKGYHKRWGNRRVQMIAIGGAIGTGLAQVQAPDYQMARTTGTGAGLSDMRHFSFHLRALGELSGASRPLPAGASSPVNFGKAACVTSRLVYFNWAMTGSSISPAVKIIHATGAAFGDAFRNGVCARRVNRVGTMNI